MRDTSATVPLVMSSQDPAAPPGPAADVPAGTPSGPTGPVAMRAAMAGFVEALHQAYADQARHLAPGEAARLPLLTAEPLQVLAVAARHLHVIATTDALPPPQGPEVVLEGSLDDGPVPLQWTLRFYDPVVLPELGLVDESAGPRPADVRRVLGITDVVYHVSVAPGGGLSPHHAQHAGTGLANSHSAAARDHESLREAARGREELADEFAVAQHLGLRHAAGLLAIAIVPTSSSVAVLAAQSDTDPVALRAAVLAALRPGPSTREDG